ASVVRGNKAIASWILVATGTLGAPPPPTLPNFSSIAEGKDPWPILSSDLSAFGTDYSLFMSMSLDAGSVPVNGSIGLDGWYQSAAGSLDLLHIGITQSGVVVSSDLPAGLTFYQLSSVDEDPNSVSTPTLSLGQIQSVIAADLKGGVVQSPLAFGMLLNGIPNSGEIAPGVAGYVHVDSIATDAAAGGSPPTPRTRTYG